MVPPSGREAGSTSSALSVGAPAPPPPEQTLVRIRSRRRARPKGQIAAIRCPKREAKLAQVAVGGPLEFPFDLKDLRVELRPVFTWILKQMQVQREALAILAHTVQPWEDILTPCEDADATGESVVPQAAPEDGQVAEGEADVPVDELAFDALSLNWMVRTQHALEEVRLRCDAVKDDNEVLTRRVEQIADDMLSPHQGKKMYLFSSGDAPFGVKRSRSELPKAVAGLERELTAAFSAAPSGQHDAGGQRRSFRDSPDPKSVHEAGAGQRELGDATPSGTSSSPRRPSGFAGTRLELESMISNAMLQEREESLQQYRRAVSALHESLQALRGRMDESDERGQAGERRRAELQGSLDGLDSRMLFLERTAGVRRHCRANADAPGAFHTDPPGSSAAREAGDAVPPSAGEPESWNQVVPGDPEATWEATFRAMDSRLESAIAAMEERLDGMHALVRTVITEGISLAMPVATPTPERPEPVRPATAPAVGDGIVGPQTRRPPSGPSAFSTRYHRRQPFSSPGGKIASPHRAPPDFKPRAERSEHTHPAVLVPSGCQWLEENSKHTLLESTCSSPSPELDHPWVGRAPPSAGIEAVASAIGRDPEKMLASMLQASVPQPSRGVSRASTPRGGSRAPAHGVLAERSRRPANAAPSRPPTR